MAKDKYSAVWVSHSSIGDYLKCPRMYYLRNIYRDPKTHHKVALMQPSLALGQAVHDTIDALSLLPVQERFTHPLSAKFQVAWEKVSGKLGGFASDEEEKKYKVRGEKMLERVEQHPGPLLNKAVKIRQELPYYWLSEEENIILCGKIDWLEYLPQTDSVRIIDFKTGKFDEDPDSLQLPIYYLLATHCQTRNVAGMQYWYLDRDDSPLDVELPNEAQAYERVLELAKRITLARKLERFVCPKKEGCRACLPYEAIVSGKGEFVGTNDFGQDIFILQSLTSTKPKETLPTVDSGDMPF